MTAPLPRPSRGQRLIGTIMDIFPTRTLLFGTQNLVPATATVVSPPASTAIGRLLNEMINRLERDGALYPVDFEGNPVPPRRDAVR